MKKKHCALIMLLVGTFTCAHGQGWYAEIDLNFNHDLYAYESISKATLTFSGVTVTGSSSTRNLTLIVKGTAPITGDITLSINGQAWEPYDQMTPYSDPMAAYLTGKYSTPCETGFFEKDGTNPLHHIYMWIRIYPRMQISSFVQLCDNITLTSTTCSPLYVWEVSDSPGGVFKAIAGKTTSSIVLTRSEIMTLGFLDPYGRKYFRVSGRPNTTSQVQVVDVYYPGPTASIDAVAPKCYNGSDGSISVDIMSPLPSTIDDFVVTLFRSLPPQDPINQDHISNGSHKTFSNVGAGNYWVRIENNSNKDLYGNCWTDHFVGTLANPKPVSGTASVSDYNSFGVSCSGASDGRIDIIASGGTGEYSTYEWSPAVSTTKTAKDLSAGDYSVRVRDSFGCWSGSVTARIREPEKLGIKLLSVGGKNGYDVSCLNKADGVIEAEVSGGVPEYTYVWSQPSTTNSLTGLRPGQYTVTVKDANDCIETDGITLHAPPAIELDIAETNGVSCPGDLSGVLEINSLVNTIGDVSIAWSSGEQTRGISGKGAGLYVANVTDAQGCTGSASWTIVEPPPYSAQLVALSDYNGSPIRCNGEANGKIEAILKDPDGMVVQSAHYSWFRNGVSYRSGDGLSQLNNVSAGVYRTEVHYTSSCKAEASLTLTEPNALVVSSKVTSDYHGSAISCAGKVDGSVRADAAGGTGSITYEWNTNMSGPELKGLPAGIYGVVVSDANGCESHSETILKDPEVLKSIVRITSDFNGQPLSCFGSSDARITGSATGGTAPYVFDWNTGYRGESLNDVPAGRYALITTDANGCESTAETTINGPSQLVINFEDQSDFNGYGTSCFGTTDGFLVAAASGGTGKHEFSWSGNFETGPDLLNVGAGQYHVTVNDENRCTSTAAAVITEPEPLTIIAFDEANVTCPGGSDGVIRLSAHGGAGPYKYSLSGATWQTEPAFVSLQSGLHHIIVTDANSCSATTAHELTEPDPIVIAFDDVGPALCGAAEGKATSIVIGGTSPYNYVWTNGAGEIVGRTKDLSKVFAGIYEVTITDDVSCQATNSVGITSTDGPRVAIAEVVATSCSYTQDGKARIEIREGDGPFTIAWGDGQASMEATGLAGGQHHVKVTDANNCSVVETVEILSPDPLEVKVIELNEPRCHGDCDGQIQVTAIGGNGQYNFSWGATSGAHIKNLCAGEYTVSVADSSSCNTTAMIRLEQPSPVTLRSITQKSPTCPENCDGEIQVEAQGGTGLLEFVWSDGTTGTGLEKLCSGTFTVTVKDAHICSAEASFRLLPPEVQALDIGQSATVCEGQEHTIDAGPGWSKFRWTSNNGFESSSRVVALSDAGTYFLETTGINGCVARDTFMLHTSTELLNAMFLLASEAFTGDTVVIIDISWPIPDTVNWTLPPGIYMMQAFPDAVVSTFAEAGLYDITMSAALGECKDELTKTIQIRQVDELLPDGGRLGYDDFVKEFTLYPNPNDGRFDVVVTLKEEAAIGLTIWNILNSRKIAQIRRTGRRHYQEHIDLAPLSAGSYSIRLDFEHGTRFLRFIVR